jgi:hypothetical protein
MSNRVTRGQATSRNLEERIIATYKKYGAKLVEAHGALATESETVNISHKVPPNTIVMLMATPGRCMYISAGRMVASEFFTNNNGLTTFFKSGEGTGWHHTADILSRTFFPGEQMPNISLVFFDKHYPSFGYVWKLPIQRRDRSTLHANLAREPPPARSEIYTNINHGNSSRLLLSTVLSRLGPGVYIINACLPPGNYKHMNFTGSNVPAEGWNGITRTMSTRTREHVRYSPYIRGQVRPPRPGSTYKTYLPSAASHWYRVRAPHTLGGKTVHDFLNALKRNKNLNFNNWVGQLRPNVNINRLRKVQNILRNPNNFYRNLSARNKMLYTTSFHKPRFIHTKLVRVQPRVQSN